MSADPGRMGFTRARDLAAVALVAAVGGYLIVLWNYHRMPPLPRLAGFLAFLLGVGEAIFGYGLRARIMANRNRGGGAVSRPPVPPLTAARAVMSAKASSLAGAAFGGLWLGLLVYLVPLSNRVIAAGSDSTTAVLGLIGAVIMIAGALYLEFCCRVPRDDSSDRLN